MHPQLPSALVAPRLTQKFALLITPEMHQALHKRAGEQMISVGELARRFMAEGLDRLDKEGGA